MSEWVSKIHRHKSYWLQAQRELDVIQSYSGPVHWHSYQCTRLLAVGDHATARVHAHKIIAAKHHHVGYYYLAKSHFLCAEYASALDCLNNFLALHPHHAEGNYLLSHIYQAQDNYDLAWQCLYELGANSKRLKTWLYLAQLVETKEQFQAMSELLTHAQKKSLLPATHPHLDQYVAHAALRAKQYPVAFSFWHQTYLRALQQPKTPKNKNQSYFSSHASTALMDLKQCLYRANIHFFLVSGTLLGCIREGRLLGHDNDIDVGIWEAVPIDELLSALRASGHFYVRAQRSPWLVKVKHVNGIPIDIFYHVKDKEENRYWHGGVKSRWYNSAFDVIEHEFLGSNYFIPADSERYLTENYGDWRTPKLQFDNIYDTPNSVVTNRYELVVHNYRALIQAVHRKNSQQVALWQHRLKELEDIWSYTP